VSQPRNGRQVLTGDDWMRDVEKSQLHEARRPRINGPGDLLGPGFRAFAVPLADWNSEKARFNGLWVAQDADNAPAPGLLFGLTLASPDGDMVQIALAHGTGAEQLYTRRGYAQVAATPTYEAWRLLAFA
jgi:hypothetical protein